MVVFANVILFLAVFMLGMAVGYRNSDEIEYWGAITRDFISKSPRYFTRKFWYNRKLKKNGIQKQILCLISSYTNQGPNVPLVEYGKIYNVIGESERVSWGDIRGSYVVKEHGEGTAHSKSVFIDYYGGNIEKILKDNRERILQLNQWFSVALIREEEKRKQEQLQNFKLLR